MDFLNQSQIHDDHDLGYLGVPLDNGNGFGQHAWIEGVAASILITFDNRHIGRCDNKYPTSGLAHRFDGLTPERAAPRDSFEAGEHRSIGGREG